MIVQAPDNGLEFRFLRPGARTVAVAGDFNAWQIRCSSMQRDGDGWWSCRLRLAPGVYQFKYWADGEWFPDYAAFGLEKGPLGWNSVVLVSASQETECVASEPGTE